MEDSVSFCKLHPAITVAQVVRLLALHSIEWEDFIADFADFRPGRETYDSRRFFRWLGY